MFLLDSLMISGIRWALQTTLTAAEAEMNDDTALRDQLLEAELRRETGEISDDEFARVERDLLGRIREIKERREGGSGPLAFGGPEPMDAGSDARLHVEASVSGDFHGDPGDAPHTTVVEQEPVTTHFLSASQSGETVQLLELDRRDTPPEARRAPARRSAGAGRTPGRRAGARRVAGRKSR